MIRNFVNWVLVLFLMFALGIGLGEVAGVYAYDTGDEKDRNFLHGWLEHLGLVK